MLMYFANSCQGSAGTKAPSYNQGSEERRGSEALMPMFFFEACSRYCSKKCRRCQPRTYSKMECMAGWHVGFERKLAKLEPLIPT